MSREHDHHGHSHEHGPTQEEIRQKAQVEFLWETKRRADRAVEKYFLGQGYFLLPRDVKTSEERLAEPIKPILATLKHAQRLVADGADLTDERKEQMLECVYQLEEIVKQSPIDHPVLKLYSARTKNVGRGALLLWLAVPVVLFAIAWPSMWKGLLFTLLPGSLFMLRGWRQKVAIERQAIKVVSTF